MSYPLPLRSAGYREPAEPSRAEQARALERASDRLESIARTCALPAQARALRRRARAVREHARYVNPS